MVLNSFIYDTNPFYNDLSLIYAKNRISEGNLKSEKHLENIEIVSVLLARLGWASRADEDRLTQEDVRTSFVESVVDEPLFKRQKRLNELFDQCKSPTASTSTWPLFSSC